jgi:hypothetical protein
MLIRRAPALLTHFPHATFFRHLLAHFPDILAKALRSLTKKGKENGRRELYDVTPYYGSSAGSLLW